MLKFLIFNFETYIFLILINSSLFFRIRIKLGTYHIVDNKHKVIESINYLIDSRKQNFYLISIIYKWKK